MAVLPSKFLTVGLRNRRLAAGAALWYNPFMSQAAACACGQVLFDVGDKKAGDTLTCPWCNRAYCYLGDGKVEPCDAKDSSDAKAAKPSSSDSEKKPASPEAPKKDAAKPDAPSSAATDEKKSAQAHDGEKSEEAKKGEGAILAAVQAKKADAAKKPRMIATARHDPTSGESPRSSVRKKRKNEIPGGVGVMVGFIVAFNAAAFIALKFLMPALPDGTRLAPWGSHVPKSAIWPEIAALLVGHFVGFIAWSTYLYYRQQRLAKQPAPPIS